MALMDNGECYGWGNNEEAVLANNHIREYVYATGYYTPTMVHQSYNGKIVDFDLSTNLSVFLTDTNEVYYSGFGKFMAPTKAEIPEGKMPIAVGASTDGFGVACDDGTVYGWNTYVEGNEKFFHHNMTRFPTDSFNGANVVSLGGKYANKYAVTG